MKWLWRRREPADVEAAAAAEQAAQRDWPEVRIVAQRAESLLKRNGFTDAIIRSMGGKTP